MILFDLSGVAAAMTRAQCMETLHRAQQQKDAFDLECELFRQRMNDGAIDVESRFISDPQRIESRKPE